MSLEDDKICIDSLENLKSLANATNKELQTLHTKHLFSHFCSNQFELLLEDIAKGKFDENQLHLTKRVHWHILNSFKTKKTKPEVCFEFLADTEDEDFSHNLSLMMENVSSKNSKASKPEKFGTISSKLNFIDTFLDHEISEHRKASKCLQFPKQRRSSAKNLVHSKDKHSKLAVKRHISLKSNSMKVPSNKNNEDVQTELFLSHSVREPRLGKYTIPNIDIPPINKSVQPGVSISPNEELNVNHSKERRILKSVLKQRSSLKQICNHDSINILPLNEQHLTNIAISASQKNKHSFTNEGLFVFEHQQLQHQSDEEFDVATDLNHSLPHSPNEEDSSPRIACDKDMSTLPITKNEERINFYSDENQRGSVSPSQENEFNPKKFIDRLEERLGTVLTTFPMQQFQNNGTATRISKDYGNPPVNGTNPNISTTSRIPHNVHVYVQTISPEKSDDTRQKSQHSDGFEKNESSIEKTSSLLPIPEHDLLPSDSSRLWEEIYSGESFEEHDDDDSVSPSEDEAEKMEDSEESQEVVKKDFADEEMDYVQKGDREATETRVEEKDAEGATIDEDDDSSSLRQTKLRSYEEENAQETGLVLPDETIANTLEEKKAQEKDIVDAESWSQAKMRSSSKEKVLLSYSSPETSKSFIQNGVDSSRSPREPEKESSSPCLTTRDSPASVKQDFVNVSVQYDGRSETSDRDLGSLSSRSEEKLNAAIVSKSDEVPDIPFPIQVQTPSSTSSSMDMAGEPGWGKAQARKYRHSDSATKSEKSASESSGCFALVNETVSFSAGETVLHSIEVGDVTVSDGEIELEVSIADIQADKPTFYTPGLDLLHESSNDNSDPIEEQTSVCDRSLMTSKDTRTQTSDDTEVVFDSSLSEGVVLGVAVLEATAHRAPAEASADVISPRTYSEGELERPSSDEIRSLEQENERLRRRLVSFTGRFCVPSNR